MRKVLVLGSVTLTASIVLALCWFVGPLMLVKVETVNVPMRDGVSLFTRVYLPMTQAPPLPVIMMRSPYHFLGDWPFSIVARVMASHGYSVVNQDVRGTGLSEGEFNPFFQERSDGYDAVEWAARQTWSNGKVGIWGVSYLGVTALQAAASTPPHLVAVATTATGSDYHEGWIYTHGVLNQHFVESWAGISLAGDAYRRRLLARGVTPDRTETLAKAWMQDAANSLGTDPGSDAGQPLRLDPGMTPPYVQEWLDHPTYDDYWSRVDLSNAYTSIQVPVLSRGGWYDIFSGGSIKNFAGMRAGGGTPSAREGSRLTMVPICHMRCPSGNSVRYPFGLLWFGSPELDWWDYWLKGIDKGFGEQRAVQLYVMRPGDQGSKGGGYWIGADQYPLADTEWRRWYLRGLADTTASDTANRLDHLPPDGTEQPDSYIYDPENPVPTLGGNLCCGTDLPSGVFDQMDVEQRDDVIVFTSAPFEHATSFVGPVRAHFWASTDAEDANFTVKLVDVRPDGTPLNLLDSIVSARFREGDTRSPSATTPGQPHAYQLSLGDLGTEIGVGHRVRVEISSSNFPHFARVINTTDGATRLDRPAIYHDAEHPSYIELPVVDTEPYRLDAASPS